MYEINSIYQIIYLSLIPTSGLQLDFKELGPDYGLHVCGYRVPSVTYLLSRCKWPWAGHLGRGHHATCQIWSVRPSHPRPSPRLRSRSLSSSRTLPANQGAIIIRVSEAERTRKESVLKRDFIKKIILALSVKRLINRVKANRF